MSQTLAYPTNTQERLSLADKRLYLVVAFMVLGNVALPYAFHQIPNGGRIFLPIFFFTLIAGWRFGLGAGILTALLSPLASHVLTGMPSVPLLFKVILHSAVLGGVAALVGQWGRKLSLPLLALVVLVHQALILTPVIWNAGFGVGLEALVSRWPGLVLQILGGFLVLRLLGRLLPIGEGTFHE